MSHDYCNIAEVQENDLEIIFMNIFKDFKDKIYKPLK